MIKPRSMTFEFLVLVSQTFEVMSSVRLVWRPEDVRRPEISISSFVSGTEALVYGSLEQPGDQRGSFWGLGVLVALFLSKEVLAFKDCSRMIELLHRFGTDHFLGFEH